jgi:1-acyl-sn-glycerol-3-phosphate acyltransferase
MPNHLSFLDGPMLEMLIPGAARIILKKPVLRIPIVGTGHAVRRVRACGPQRGGGRQEEHRQGRGPDAGEGYSFLIFPEGTRSRDGKLQRFRRGGFFLALETGAPIVPVTIRGTFELMPKGQRFARKGQVRVEFHEPVPVSGHGRHGEYGRTDGQGQKSDRRGRTMKATDKPYGAVIVELEAGRKS